MTQVVELLRCKYKALSSNLSLTKKKREREREMDREWERTPKSGTRIRMQPQVRWLNLDLRRPESQHQLSGNIRDKEVC
jgi:hypothetical protein